MIKNLRTTALGILQLAIAVSFVWAKFRNPIPLSDSEVALLETILISGIKGLVSADAKPMEVTK